MSDFITYFFLQFFIWVFFESIFSGWFMMINFIIILETFSCLLNFTQLARLVSLLGRVLKKVLKNGPLVFFLKIN